MSRLPDGPAREARGSGQADLVICEQAIDITYIPTREGWLYLAAVEDLYSRMVVGWSMADRLQSRLVVEALALAVQRRLPGEGLLAHSDRGSQYASAHYQLLLAKHGIACSMSRRADCWDNAPMESFFCLLEEGVGPRRGLRHEGGGSGGDLRVHRDLLQPQTTAFIAGVRLPGSVRTGGIIVNPLSTFRGELHTSHPRGTASILL
jgi:hypothetical protein